jgi:uncharacterized membrane protein
MSLPANLPWLTNAAALAVLAVATLRLPWYKLRGDAEAQRVFFMAALALALLRGFNSHALAGVQLNFIGAMVATLMFGPRFALWAMLPASLLGWAFNAAWLGPGADFLVTAAAPVLLAQGWSRLAERFLPPNLFIYLIVQAFFGGALTLAACNVLKAAASAWLGLDHAGFYLLATAPMMFGEAFLSGGAMTLIVVYRPQWCSSFDDARYLRKR